MDPISIIFFDIDGTLVDPRTGKISEKTMYTLSRLQERGIRICISTGRAPSEIPDFGALRFDAYCTYNGSLCYTEDQVLHSNPIAPADVMQVIQNASAIGRPVSVAVRNRLAANGLDADLADYYRLADLELTVAPDFDAACREDVYQILIGCRPSEHAALVKGVQSVKIAVSWDRAVDVIPSSSGKGRAIAEVLAHFGVAASQAMAFGDSQNDLEMLQAVGVGVAMGNASEPVKAIADEVCGAVWDEGIYHFCLSRGLL